MGFQKANSCGSEGVTQLQLLVTIVVITNKIIYNNMVVVVVMGDGDDQ